MDDAARDTERQLVVGGTDGHDDTELVTAEPRHHAVALDDLRQAVGNSAQHLISKAMAVKVIDRFEMIEIEHEQGTALILTGVSRLGVKLFQKPPAIGEPGQRVVAREPLSILFGRTPLFHLLTAVSYTHLRAHETRHDLVCRLLLE